MRDPDRFIKDHLRRCASDWSVGMMTLTLILLVAIVIAPPMRSLWVALPGTVERLMGGLRPLPPPQATLFNSLNAVGVVAIGHAEGNLTVTGEPTGNYWGHEDPGNFRRNQGWCSDQGRGGGNVDRANQKCLERVQERLALIEQDLRNAELNPEQDPEVLINAVDLYNQASPWVSRQFPAAYRAAQRRGLSGETALVWARVEAFRRRGKIDASGLIGICQREGRQVSDWDCVAADQRRRVRAIARVWAAQS